MSEISAVNNWQETPVPDLLRALRKLKKQNQLNLIPASEMYAHPDRRVRRELLKHFQMKTVSDWEQIGLQVLTSPQVEEALKTFKQLPPVGHDNYSSEVFHKALKAVIESDTVTEKVIAEFINRKEVSGVTLNALASKQASERICVAVIQNSATVEAINYQLDNLPRNSFHIRAGRPSSETVEIMMTDDALAYRNFYKLHTTVLGHNSHTSLEPQYAGSLSQNYLRARREGLIGRDRGDKSARPLNRMDSINRFSSKQLFTAKDEHADSAIFREMFPTDQTWKDLMKFGMLPKQVALVEDLLTTFLKIHLINSRLEERASRAPDKGKFETVPQLEFSTAAQEVIVEYAKADRNILNQLILNLRIEPTLLSEENIHKLFHSLNPEDLFLLPDKDPSFYGGVFSNPEKFFNLVRICCEGDIVADCPAWQALYRWRYFVSASKRKPFNRFSDVTAGTFFPYIVSPAVIANVPSEEIEAMLAYAEQKGLENITAGERETYMVLSTFL